MVRAAFVVVVVVVVVGLFSGCEPQPRSAACVQYVACQSAYDEAAGLDAADRADTADYADKDGSCWQSPDVAERCNTECLEALDSLRAAAAAADLRVEECDEADRPLAGSE